MAKQKDEYRDNIVSQQGGHGGCPPGNDPPDDNPEYSHTKTPHPTRVSTPLQRPQSDFTDFPAAQE